MGLMPNDLERLIELHSEAIGHAARCNNPAACAEDAGREALLIAQDAFAQAFRHLDDRTVTATLEFYASPAGRKNLKAADAVAVNLDVASPSSGGHMLPDFAANSEKTRELAAVLGFEETLSEYQGHETIPISQITRVFMQTYGALLDATELDEAIRFYGSDDGQAYLRATNEAGRQIAASSLA